VPYDGSRFADKALENAIGIAKLSGAETQIILLHVTPHIPIPLTFERRKFTHYNIKIEAILLGGYPAEKIIEFANNEKVDLIVIGSVGLSGLSKVKAMGSVSRNVSERASCPVLIVH
jgi:nucleotide-binding universal stress UspA family protein